MQTAKETACTAKPGCRTHAMVGDLAGNPGNTVGIIGLRLVLPLLREQTSSASPEQQKWTGLC